MNLANVFGLAVLSLPCAVLAQEYAWINFESTGALEATEFASSAVRMPDSLRIAADDFLVGEPVRLSEVVFYSVWIDPPVILGGDWYIYQYDEATRSPGALVVGAFDVALETADSGLVSGNFGTIYRNAMAVDIELEPGRYFLGFRTHVAPGAGKPVNAPLHPEWSNGDATAQWNFSALTSGEVFEAWMPMTDFHPTLKEWAFELHGTSRTCLADIDGDGSLTLFDFLEFQNLFAGGDPRADFDGDGSLTLFDFLEFQNAFAAGCE